MNDIFEELEPQIKQPAPEPTQPEPTVELQDVMRGKVLTVDQPMIERWIHNAAARPIRQYDTILLTVAPSQISLVLHISKRALKPKGRLLLPAELVTWAPVIQMKQVAPAPAGLVRFEI